MPPKVPEGYQVTIPTWDDVIHIRPDSSLSRGELGRRRGERARRIRRSPTPAIVNSAREILTWVDDVQDSLVTLSLATRVLVKNTGKIIPGARTIARLADALNVSTALSAIGNRFPQDKRGMRDLMRRSPRSYQARLLRTARTRRVNVGLGELLQVAQTSDTLLGVGISLGAIMAAPIDALFLGTTGGDLTIPLPTLDAERSLHAVGAIDMTNIFRADTTAFEVLVRTGILPEGELTFHIPKFLPTLWEIGQAFLPPPFRTETIEVLDAADTALEAAPFLGYEGQALSFDDHLAALAAQHMALQLLMPLHALRDWTPYALLKKAIDIPRHLTLRPETAVAMLAAGLDPNHPGALALPGAPMTATWGQVQDLVPTRAAAAAAHWRAEAPDPDHARFAGHLQWEVTQQYLAALEGPNGQIEESLTPEAQAIELMLNAEIPPAVWTNRPALEALHRALTDTLKVTGSTRLSPDTFQRAAAAALAAHPLP